MTSKHIVGEYKRDHQYLSLGMFVIVVIVLCSYFLFYCVPMTHHDTGVLSRHTESGAI